MARMEVSFGLLITPPSSQARERERVSDLNLLSKLPLSLSLITRLPQLPVERREKEVFFGC
jgi:hypothetical protein